MPAEVVRLSDVRARRAGIAPPGPPPKPAPAYLATAPGKVLFELSDGTGFDLSAAHARIWAERLAAMADTAEALEREGGR